MIYAVEPPFGSPLNRNSPLFQAGLVAFFGLLEHGGGIYDSVSGFNLSLTGSPTWSNAGICSGLSCAGTSGNVGASATMPAWLKVQPPFTIACGFRRLGATVQYGALLGLFSNNNNANPYLTGAIEYANTSGGLQYAYPSHQAVNSGQSVAVGTDHVAVLTLAPGSTNNANFYLDGALVASQSAGGVGSYASTALIGIGNYASASGYSSNSLIYWAGIWNQVLSPSLIAANLASVNDVWSLYDTPPSIWVPGPVSVAMPAMSWCSQP